MAIPCTQKGYSKDRNSTHDNTVVKTDTILIDVDDTTATNNLDTPVAIETKPLKQVDKMSQPLFKLEEIKTDLKKLMEEGPAYNQTLVRAAQNSADRNLMTPDEYILSQCWQARPWTFIFYIIFI